MEMLRSLRGDKHEFCLTGALVYADGIAITCDTITMPKMFFDASK